MGLSKRQKEKEIGKLVSCTTEIYLCVHPHLPAGAANLRVDFKYAIQ